MTSTQVTTDGLDGDRRYVIHDVTTGFGLTARRFPQLLFASARIEDDVIRITLPDGSIAADDAALSSWLDRPVVLRSTADDADRRYENPDDFEHEDDGQWQPFDGAPGAFHDSAAAKISLVSNATVNGWEPRRFRANILLDGDGEDDLVGHRVAVGDSLLDVVMRIDRCVMVTRAQPGGVERDVEVLRAIHRQRQGSLAVGATVARTGTLSVGDILATV